MSGPGQLLSHTPDGALPGIWKEVGEQVNLEAMAGLLRFNKKEIASAARVKPGSFSYQKPLPPELQQRVIEWARVFELVARFFDNDPEQTAKWFRTPNYMLGGLEPRHMIQFGRAGKLIRLIQDELAGNVP
jgi:uncharacterized protein (DUF2384 family)